MSNTNPKTWLITGANRGLGQAMARAALAAGHNVVASARKLEELQAAFPVENARLALAALDVTDDAQSGAAVDAAISRFGRIDILVNNAGYGALGWFENFTDEEIRRQFEVNLFGAFSVTRRVLPHMRAQRSGHVISISSIAGLRSAAGSTVYCSSKFALEGWMEGLAAELAPLGIHATIIEPGYFRTDFFDESSANYPEGDIADYAQVSRESREFRRSMNHQQVGDPERLGKVVVDLTEMEQPPVRIALGSDASEWAEGKGHNIVEEAIRWRPISASTDGETGIRVN
jgi:NAD(P)-dependent dehydrogenase (short-subunit alcohol dehydrogenase family)